MQKYYDLRILPHFIYNNRCCNSNFHVTGTSYHAIKWQERNQILGRIQITQHADANFKNQKNFPIWGFNFQCWRSYELTKASVLDCVLKIYLAIKMLKNVKQNILMHNF